MKKTIFSLVFAIMFGMALGSCGNGATGAATEVDSVVVEDTAVVDSVVADTVAMDSVVVAE